MQRTCTDPSLIEQSVNRILSSDCFARSPQARRFLRYVVECAVAGNGASLKAYTIGVSALGVNTDRSCPETTARMQASRVRRLLAKYYQLEGKSDRVELCLPTGVYEPRFQHRSSPPTVGSFVPRVQVGPFDSLSGEKLDEQLCRGLSESLLGLLVNCKHLRVVRHDEARAELANYVLAGSVTRGGTSVRLSCHLQATEAGETVWSDRVDRKLYTENFLSVQDEIAAQLACRVGDPALGAVAKAHRRENTSDPAAAALDRFFQLLEHPSVRELDAVRRQLEQALPKSNESCSLQAAYSCALSLSYLASPSARKAELISAEAHARTAVSQESTCGLAHFAKALVHYHHREGACAMRELQRVVELDEVSAILRAGSGLLMTLMGNSKEGLQLLDDCQAKLPQLPRYFSIAYSLYYFHEVGDPHRALSFAQQLDLEDGFWSHLISTASLSRLGRSVEARSFAGRVAENASFAKKPKKRLSDLLFQESLTDSLCVALSDAGLGAPTHQRRSRAEFKVALSRRELPSEIRVGILQSLSGTMALSEAHLVNAAMLAIDEINQAGGVLGRPVRALVEDGASDPTTFRNKAQKLVEQDRVGSIFGCWTSSSRKAVLPIVEQQNALLWYPLQYEGLEKSKHVVYTGSCLNQQIEPAVRWALKGQKNSCFLVGSDYVFPRTANRLIRALVESRGGHVMGENYQPLGEADFEGVAREIARLKPEIVYNTVNGSENIALFQALEKAGVHARETPIMSFSLSELELSQCGPAAQGQLACWSYFQSLDTPKNRELLARFRRRYGQSEVLSDPAVTAYCQVHLWKNVVEKAHSLETDELLTHLTGSILQLGDESLEILENHHVRRRALIGQAVGREFRVIWSSPQAIAPQPWLGVDQTDFLSRDLILGALQALPEMAERSSNLARQVQGRSAAQRGVTFDR